MFNFTTIPATRLWRLAAGGASRCAVIAAALLIIIGVQGCVNDNDEAPRSVAVGSDCPQFSVILSDGIRVSTPALAGRKTMIVFFNTSCGDCRRELPEIQKVADELARDGAGSLAGSDDVEGGIPRVFCVSRAEGDESVAAFWYVNGLTLPYSAQSDAAVYNLFASAVIPRVYIIGADLKISASYAETLPKAEELLKLMR